MVFTSVRALPQFRLVAAAAFALAVMAPQASFAGDKAPPAFDKSDKMHGDAHILSGQHVEGHIAFLHAELGITPEQEKLWAPVADAMRQDVYAMQDAEDKIAGQSHSHENAMQYLHNRAIFAGLRADAEARFLNAMLPLYDALSDEQKQSADDLLIPHPPEQS